VGVLLLVGGLGLLSLPGLTGRLGRRLPPEEWARLCAGCLGVGAVIVELACVLYALPTVLRAARVPAIAALCERAIHLFLPGGRPAGWAAAAAAVTIPGLATLGLSRARRCSRTVRAEPSLGSHRPLGHHDLVVLPTPQLLAVSVAGTPSQIVISGGLVAALTDAQLDLVLRHEAAHLDLDHQRRLEFGAAVDHAFAFWPPARRSTQILRTALERSADEVAAGDAPEQRRELRAALLGATAMALSPADIAAFSPVETVAERLDALEHDQPKASMLVRSGLYTATAANAGVVLIAVAAWGGEARMLLSMAGRCST